jgi:hypothetical protein
MMPELKLSITTRVIPADDVARTLVSFTEHGIEGASTSDTGAIGHDRTGYTWTQRY